MRWLCFDYDMGKYTSDYRARKKDVYELAKISFLYSFKRDGEEYEFVCPYLDKTFKSTEYMTAFADMKHKLEKVAVRLTNDASVITDCCVTPAVNFETSIMKWRIDDS